MSNVTKKMKLTIVKYVKTVVEDGAAKVVEMPDRAFPGTLSKARAANILKKELGDVSFTIVSMETAEHTYSMDLNVFLQHAVEIDAAGGATPPDSPDGESQNSEVSGEQSAS